MPSALIRHARSQGSSVLRRGVLAALALVLLAGAAIGVAYADLQSQLRTVDIAELVPAPTGYSDGVAAAAATPADPSEGSAFNLLIIGSDSREDGAVDDGVSSVLADTHVIVHIAADRSRVELVSIPRDTMVDIPACRTTSGGTVAARFGQYNDAFADAYLVGGDVASAIACDVTLAQSVSGLRLDGFVLVEMGGFVSMVDALGGVDIDIAEAIDAPKAGLTLAAGQQTLTGTQALGYARARVGVGDGSDTGRIQRQQHLMAALVEEVLSRNLLTDTGALYGLASATLSSLTVSENLAGISDLVGLGLSLKRLDASAVTFVTTPYRAYPADPNRVEFTAEAEVLWASLRDDRPIGGADDPGGAASTGGSGATE